MFVGCVALATSCDLTENVQVKADKSMIFGSKSGLELYSNSFYKALPTLKNGFMQDKMCDVGAVSNTDTFIKQGAYNTETATSWSWGALKNINYFIDGCNARNTAPSTTIRATTTSASPAGSVRGFTTIS